MKIDPRQITVAADRQRQDFGNLDELKDSIKQFGIIQPLVVEPDPVASLPDRPFYRLIAGERRLKCARDLNLSYVPIHLFENLSPLQREAIELEENLRRKSITWQEQVCAVARIHELQEREAVLDSRTWTMSLTGEMLGVSAANVCYSTQLADLVRKRDKDILNASGVMDAYRILCQRKEREAQAELAKRLTLLPTKIIAPTTKLKYKGQEGCVACGGTGYNSRGGPCICATVIPGDTEPLAHEQSATPVVAGTGLSLVIDNARFEDWSKQPRVFDHIYCDPPYAIDMDNIQQPGTGMNVEAVRETHDVKDNLALLSHLCSWLPRVLPPHGIAVIWCDYTQWETIKNWLEWEDDLADSQPAKRTTLRVQNWPFIWVKTSPCQNSAAYSNFTKTHECALVAYGPKATLALAGPAGHWVGESDKRDHSPTNPFWKPLALHKHIIEAISKPGQIICDPFAGSGSIPRACQLNGRSVLANEMDPVHYTDMRIRLLGEKPSAQPELIP